MTNQDCPKSNLSFLHLIGEVFSSPRSVGFALFGSSGRTAVLKSEKAKSVEIVRQVPILPRTARIVNIITKKQQVKIESRRKLLQLFFKEP